MPGVHTMVLPDTPDFTIVASTDEFAAFSGCAVADLTGNSLFRYFPDNPEAPVSSDDIKKSLAKCMQTKQKSKLPVQRYDIRNAEGSFDEMYWTVEHTPLLDEAQNIMFIIHTAIDVTDKVLSAKKDAQIRSFEPAYDLFMQASVAIHIFKGPDLVVEMANAPTLKLWGKDASVIGRPLRDALPELAGQGYFEKIRNVLESGQASRAFEVPVRLLRNGAEDTVYVNYILQPYYDRGRTRPTAVLAMVNEVTDNYLSRQELAEKERNLELAIEIGGLGMFDIDLASSEAKLSTQVMEWFSVTESRVPLSELLHRIHPDERDIVRETLNAISESRDTGRHDLVFRVIHPTTGETRYIRSIAQARRDVGRPNIISGILQDMTRIIRSKDEIEQIAQRLRSVIASAPFPMGVYEGRGMKVVMANQSLIDVWGKGPDIFGKTYHEMLPELKDTGIYEALDRVFMTGEPFHAHNSRVDLVVDGTMRSFWFNYSFLPLFDADGKVYGVMNTASDVTDLNLAKQEIEESEYRYRTLIEESTVAAALYSGPELRIQYANDIMLAYWGKGSDAIGLPLDAAVPELQGQPFLSQLQRVMTNGETVNGFQVKALLRQHGVLSERYFNYTYKPLHDAGGTIYGIHHMAIDVTSEVLAKKEVEETALNFRNMIMQAPVAICVLKGPDYIFDIVNPMMSILVGRPIDELEGRPMFEAMPELPGNNLGPQLEAVMAGGTFVSDEQAFELLRDGEMQTAYIRYIYEPMKDATGKINGVMAVATDVTPQVLARRQIEEIVHERTYELAEANARLEVSNAELKQFAYIASHDLQEPLRKISMFSQRLEGALGALDGEARAYMDRISSSVSRMSNLIRDILGYSQLSRENERFVATDLEQTLAETLPDFDLILEETKGRIEHSPLPQIEAIPLQMLQLFHNLISNSLKYSHPDRPPLIRITASTASAEEIGTARLPESAGGYLKLTFSDNGIGFPEQYADKIFQIFQRLHGKTEYEGTGIGLAMCRKIAENHKGTIFASGGQEGAVFTILLPKRHVPLINDKS